LFLLVESLLRFERAIQDARSFAERRFGWQVCWKNEIVEDTENCMLRLVLVEYSFGKAACDRSVICAIVSGEDVTYVAPLRTSLSFPAKVTRELWLLATSSSRLP
jgi:hypothetical protein